MSASCLERLCNRSIAALQLECLCKDLSTLCIFYQSENQATELYNKDNHLIYDSPIYASISIYLDIINLFLNLLRIFVGCED